MSSCFAHRLVAWQRQHGRHHLPWQAHLGPTSTLAERQAAAYRVWLSEIMLQQTQVSTVIPYFERFMARFPDLPTLADAPLDAVLALWAGLGYYARARNLHRCAQVVLRDHGGHFPAHSLALATLPGIGRSTGAAIAAFAFGERAAILDGNVRRVLCRHFGIEGFPGERAVLQQLWQVAEDCLPKAADDMTAYTQGLMDLGSMVCRRSQPDCPQCPLANSCRAYAENRQAELPTPRPKRVIPQKSVAFVLPYTADGLWYLETRPPRGLWGGMLAPWSWQNQHMGNHAETQTALSQALETLGFRLLDCQPGDILSHTFTHFQWHIQPWYCRVEALTPDPQRWRSLSSAELDHAPLPTPVQTLLRRV